MNYFVKLALFLPKQGAPALLAGVAPPRPRGRGVRPQGLADRVGADVRSRGPLSSISLWSGPLAPVGDPGWTQAWPGRRGARRDGRARPPAATGRGGSAGKVFEEIYSDMLLRESHPSRGSVYETPRPVDWSVTVICGSSPEVMGSNWARERQPDRLLNRAGGRPARFIDLDLRRSLQRL